MTVSIPPADVAFRLLTVVQAPPATDIVECTSLRDHASHALIIDRSSGLDTPLYAVQAPASIFDDWLTKMFRESMHCSDVQSSLRDASHIGKTQAKSNLKTAAECQSVITSSYSITYAYKHKNYLSLGYLLLSYRDLLDVSFHPDNGCAVELLTMVCVCCWSQASKQRVVKASCPPRKLMPSPSSYSCSSSVPG